MLTEQQYRELINEAITAINYPAEPSGLYQPISYTLAGGGKRFAPYTAACCGTQLRNGSGQSHETGSWH